MDVSTLCSRVKIPQFQFNDIDNLEELIFASKKDYRCCGDGSSAGLSCEAQLCNNWNQIIVGVSRFFKMKQRRLVWTSSWMIIFDAIGNAKQKIFMRDVVHPDMPLAIGRILIAMVIKTLKSTTLGAELTLLAFCKQKRIKRHSSSWSLRALPATSDFHLFMAMIDASIVSLLL